MAYIFGYIVLIEFVYLLTDASVEFFRWDFSASFS